MLFKILFFVTLQFGASRQESCPGMINKPAEARLRDKLFCAHNKAVRPVKFFTNETVVKIQLYVQSINLEEHTEKLVIKGNMLYVWRDAFLSWDVREYEGLDFLRVSSDEIWVPDIVTNIAQESGHRMNTVDCHVDPRGDIWCLPPVSLETYCSPDVTRFPYDQQTCNVTFSSFGLPGKYLNLTMYDRVHPVSFVVFKPNKQWELLKGEGTRIIMYFIANQSDSFYPSIRYDFLLQRHSGLLQVTFLLPTTVIAVLILLTFWLDTMFSTRAILCSFGVFCNSTFLLNIFWILPYTGSATPMLATFYRSSMVVAVFSLAICAAVRHLKSKSDPLYPWLSSLLATVDASIAGSFLLGGGDSGPEDTTAIIEASEEKKKRGPWVQVGTFVDRIGFISALIVFLILYLFYLP